MIEIHKHLAESVRSGSKLKRSSLPAEPTVDGIIQSLEQAGYTGVFPKAHQYTDDIIVYARMNRIEKWYHKGPCLADRDTWWVQFGNLDTAFLCREKSSGSPSVRMFRETSFDADYHSKNVRYFDTYEELKQEVFDTLGT